MQTARFSIAAMQLPVAPSDPAADMEARRLAVRQAGWRVRQAERRLRVMRGLVGELMPGEPGHAAAVADLHRCERALFNRQLELRATCDAFRRHQPCRSALEPETRPQ